MSTVGPEIHCFNSKQCIIDDFGNPKNEISTSQIKECPGEFEQILDDHQISDLLLSKALFNLVNENEENIYKKPREKTYRQRTSANIVTF